MTTPTDDLAQASGLLSDAVFLLKRGMPCECLGYGSIGQRADGTHYRTSGISHKCGRCLLLERVDAFFANQVAHESRAQPDRALHILFDGLPGPTARRFVGIEDDSGKSINAGEWKQRDDGYWELVIVQPAQPASVAENVSDVLHEAELMLNKYKRLLQWDSHEWHHAEAVRSRVARVAAAPQPPASVADDRLEEMRCTILQQATQLFDWKSPDDRAWLYAGFEKTVNSYFEELGSSKATAFTPRPPVLEKWRELRGHVAGMQCAIDNCGINKDEWNEAAKYAMDNMGEWKRLLSEYADYLSRTSVPVAIIRDLEDTAAFGGMGSPSFHQDEWERLRDLPAGTKIFTHLPEAARDAKRLDAIDKWTAAGRRIEFAKSLYTPGVEIGLHEPIKAFARNSVREAIDAAMAQESGE